MISQIIEDYIPANIDKGIWRTNKYDMGRSADIARYVARKRYAFPGGYELSAVTDDGALLCHDCCKSEYYLIKTSFPGDGWHCAAVNITYSGEDSAICDHCSKEIG